MEKTQIAMWGALKAVKLMAPYLVGAIGGFLATNYADMYQALCHAGV